MLGSVLYGTEIDLWAAGCVLAEMLRGGKLLFEGKTNTDQLIKIIKVLGTPSELDVKRMNPTYPYKEVVKVKPSI